MDKREEMPGGRFAARAGDMLTQVTSGNSFEIWLHEQWTSILGESSRSIVSIQSQIRSVLASLRRQESIDAHGQCLANYLCSLQFVDDFGWRRGPWSFMTDEEWKVVARLTELECWERDTDWWDKQ